MLHPFKWRKEQERIRKLRDELLALGEFPAPHVFRKAFAYTAKVYNICSFFEDAGPICYAPRKKKKLQDEFNKLINQAGRTHHGVNRSSRGEHVTLDNTYWGGIYGLHPYQTGRFWESCMEKCLYFGSPDEAPYSARVLVDFQLRPIATSHRRKLLRVCELLLG